MNHILKKILEEEKGRARQRKPEVIMGLPPAWQGIFLCFSFISLIKKKSWNTEFLIMGLDIFAFSLQIGNLGINNALNVVDMQSQAAWHTFKKRERQSSENLVKIWAILNGDAREGKTRQEEETRGDYGVTWLPLNSSTCTTFKTPPTYKDAEISSLFLFSFYIPTQTKLQK